MNIRTERYSNWVSTFRWVIRGWESGTKRRTCCLSMMNRNDTLERRGWVYTVWRNCAAQKDNLELRFCRNKRRISVISFNLTSNQLRIFLFSFFMHFSLTKDKIYIPTTCHGTKALIFSSLRSSKFFHLRIELRFFQILKN